AKIPKADRRHGTKPGAIQGQTTGRTSAAGRASARTPANDKTPSRKHAHQSKPAYGKKRAKSGGHPASPTTACPKQHSKYAKPDAATCRRKGEATTSSRKAGL